MRKPWKVYFNESMSFRPKVNNVMLDTGAAGIFMYYEDQYKIVDMLCSHIDKRFNASIDTAKPVQCEHLGRGFIKISNCGADEVKNMPAIDI
jgi:hypothetical protein